MTSPLTAHLGYWLRAVSNHVSQGFAARLAVEGTSIAEWVLLRDLYDGPGLAPSQLADRMGLSRGAVTKLADRLITRGLLARAAGQQDGRARELSLTTAGRALVPRLAALADQNDAAAFGHLPAADRADLDRLLRSLIHDHALTAAPID
jgi:DNA-binding MarR family transcriptional regulator